MGCYSRRRGRLFERKLFRNDNSWTVGDWVCTLIFSNIVLAVFIAIFSIIDVARKVQNDSPNEIKDFVGCSLLFFEAYLFFLGFLVLIVFCWIPEKYFKFCSFLAIAHIFLILFLVFHPYQTFVPGPNIEKVEDFFKYSYYAAFIWIPLLIISLFLCSIVSWKASDQSELYAVILDEKGSSTKVTDNV